MNCGFDADIRLVSRRARSVKCQRTDKNWARALILWAALAVNASCELEKEKLILDLELRNHMELLILTS